MLVIDDILLSPYKGLLWVFEEIHKTAVDELEGEAERIRNELTDLYMMLETEQIDDDEFDRRETALLDRLDQLEQESLAGEDDDGDADEEADIGDADALPPATLRVLLDGTDHDAAHRRETVLEAEHEVLEAEHD
jgi:hypothetical protein